MTSSQLAAYDRRMKSTPAVDLPPAHTLAWVTVQALRRLGDSGKVEEINETAVELAGLTEQQQEVPHKVGSRTEVEYRLAWARTLCKLLGLATAAPFEVVTVDTWADCHRRFDEDSVAWKVARGVLAAAADDAELAARAATWVQGLRQYADEGRFLFTVTDVVVVLRRPPAA